MTNLERLKMETRNINIPDNELTIYLEETGLTAAAVYDTNSAASKRSIYVTALSVLESLANDPTLMKQYKYDDVTVSDFAENLQSRIDQLERKIRMMSASDTSSENSNVFMLFQA